VIEKVFHFLDKKRFMFQKRKFFLRESSSLASKRRFFNDLRSSKEPLKNDISGIVPT
jgi:hypothetical protein